MLLGSLLDLPKSQDYYQSAYSSGLKRYMIAIARDCKSAMLRCGYAKNDWKSRKPQYFYRLIPVNNGSLTVQKTQVSVMTLACTGCG